MERETRFIPVEGLELRTGEDGKRGIAGTAAVFNRSTVIGRWFEEVILPGAFDEALKESDVRGLFNHDPNYVLGRTSSGTMSLAADEKALRFEIPELPKARADVLEAIERKDVTGNSFSFTIDSDADEEWIDRSKERKLPLRRIKRVGRLFDVGPVTFPAYEQTKVSARSQEIAERMAQEEVAVPEPAGPDVDTLERMIRLRENEDAA